MPPPRSRPPPEDSRSEASSTKEKAAASNSAAPNGKIRRVPGITTGGSSLRDVVTAGPSNSGAISTAMIESSGPGLNWSEFDASVLHGYRYAYRLNTPAGFNKPSNQLVLSRSTIGRRSPTMVGRKDQRKQSKEALAKEVRKHFNNAGIIESEVVVDFLYKVRWQDKNFRLRFTPPRPAPR